MIQFDLCIFFKWVEDVEATHLVIQFVSILTRNWGKKNGSILDGHPKVFVCICWVWKKHAHITHLKHLQRPKKTFTNLTKNWTSFQFGVPNDSVVVLPIHHVFRVYSGWLKVLVCVCIHHSNRTQTLPHSLEDLRPIKWKVNPRKDESDGFKAHSGGCFTSSDSVATRLLFFWGDFLNKKRHVKFMCHKKKARGSIPNIYTAFPAK